MRHHELPAVLVAYLQSISACSSISLEKTSLKKNTDMEIQLETVSYAKSCVDSRRRKRQSMHQPKRSRYR
ncbi:hypothetical protein L916_08576 [Phytophthora nicotianae]|uniref:Uncharacterized protein n=1 Tax=Phytophthora nicotianae TaxID=4792 RepID=W2J1G5_PHYNI|nr:hypothetical protein L916_08576 [Phytophthora nicotianae]